MNIKQPLDRTKQLTNHLRNIHWLPMNYMIFPSLLSSADKSIAELELLQQHSGVMPVHNNPRFHRRHFKRITDYWENGPSKFKYPFTISADTNFPMQMVQGIKAFK